MVWISAKCCGSGMIGDMTALKRLIYALGPYWRGLTLTTFFILVQTALGLVPPLFQREIVDGVIGARQVERLLPLILGLVVIYALTGLTEFGDQYLRHTIGERILYDLRVRIYDHLQRLSLSFFERTSTGELMSRVSNDVNALEQFITHGTILTAVAALRLVGVPMVLLALDWRLALLALLPVPLIAFGLRWFNRRARPIYRRVRDRLGDINARLQDDLAGIRVIQAFGQEDAELDRFRERQPAPTWTSASRPSARGPPSSLRSASCPTLGGVAGAGRGRADGGARAG